MIRANLLPRPKETLRLFGAAVEIDYLREALMGLLTVGLVAAIGIGIEEIRLHRLDGVLAAYDAALETQTQNRAISKRLALDVAKYQEFAREAATFRRSGALAALAIARIGNKVPPAVWLESLDRDTKGYTLSGGSRSVDVLSGAVLSLGDALPGASASLLSIDNHAGQRDGVRFQARVGSLDAIVNAPVVR